jgi:hypothetical protein
VFREALLSYQSNHVQVLKAPGSEVSS